ncbi:MAG TPA: adenylosuccinate lyase [Anaerolineae bacterium]|nr:adenylosuccinate lyase [Anaerolineae bacterium]HQK14659.1 adenylosuccinate lyase [Anaerolineae bacterium]
MTHPDPYVSPFTWRYGSPEMRALWSELYARRLYRRIWVALARVQSRYGLVTPEQLADLETHAEEVDFARSLEIEARIHHDVMAEIRAFAEQCPIGGGIIHLGATSMDVRDNATALQVRDALDLLISRLDALLLVFAAQIEQRAALPCMGFTHLQPAEPTTVGYRLAAYAQDLLADRADLVRVRAEWRGKGFKGAVGTSASYQLLLEGQTDAATFEAEVMAELGLPAWPVANQTYPRRQDWAVLTALTGLGSTLYRFAFDLRVLQNPTIGEWAEPFGSQQVGSSAMPFKRNPIRAENVNSLARYLAQLSRVAWDDAAHSLLERTLDDSANRRIILPEAFLTADELLGTVTRLVRDLRINEAAIARTLAIYGPFAGIEPLLMRLVKAGADRQAMHEILRDGAMQAWAAVEAGEPNPLAELLATDQRLLAYLDATTIRASLDACDYIGDAPQRASALAQRIRETVGGAAG